MHIRPATLADIPHIQRVRHAVRENRLSDPALVTDSDCAEFLMERGRGWVCECDGVVRGFAIVDLKDCNVWALFVEQGFERRGAGRKLHDTMLDWYFSQTDKTLWLSTAPGTRAEGFYRRAGWLETGLHGKNEIRFEMTADRWKDR